MTVSGVLLVKNMARYLPFCFSTLPKLDELIVVVDKSHDGSEQIIEKYAGDFAKIYVRETTLGWKNPIADAAEYGFSKASGDYIFALVADMAYDPRTFTEPLNVDMIGFRQIDWNLDTALIRRGYEYVLERLYRFLAQKSIVADYWRGGLFAVKHDTWLKLRFHDVPFQNGEHDQYVDFCKRLVANGGSYKYVDSTRNLHLKVDTFQEKSQFQQGMLRSSLARAIIHSALHLKPYVLKGYLNRRT
jgi:glycosyltransferase involved in cell wall biosynthesis